MGKIMLNGVEYSSSANDGVTSIKGNNESTYRTGDVNLTPENIGAIPSDGGEFSGEVLFSEGTMVSRQIGTGGTNGYVNIIQIKINKAYINAPLVFEITGRGWDFSRRLHVCFENINSLDPKLSYFLIDTIEARTMFIVKSATSTWNIYMKKSEGYGQCFIYAMHNPYNLKIIYPDTQISEIPSDARMLDVITWSKAADADTVDGKHASDFVNKSGDSMTGDLCVPAGRSSRNMSVPCCGRIDAVSSISDFSNYKTFLGSYFDGNIFNYILSIRHANGNGDGTDMECI